MTKQEFLSNYYDMFDVYKKGGITFDELVTELMLKENIIDIKEYHEILEGLVIKLGHPQYIKFEKKYKALLNHYNRGLCNLQELVDAIDILDRFKFKELY